MDRQQNMQALLEHMEAIGKAMASRALEQPRSDMPTHAQLGVLLIVLHRGPQNIKTLANIFRMTSSAATQLVNGLVRDGLLRREEDKDDRRKISVHLTQKGKRLLVIARKQRLQNMVRIFETLSNTDLEQLEKIHRKVIQQLQLLWTKNKTSN